LCKS
jgi:phytoene dehydrogenase-like protein